MAWDAGPGFGPPSGRSVACAGQAHQNCGHVRAALRTPVSRHHLESTITLCRCSCHAACPLADRMPVSLTAWQRLCACPGAEEQRAWKEDRDEPRPGVTKESRERTRREWRERDEARKQALRAVRRAGRGRTREELRDLYVAELRARGLKVPPEPSLEADIDFLTGHPLQGLRRIWSTGPEHFTDL